MSRTPEQIRDTSIARFSELAADKFDAGQEEHGGILDQCVTFERLEGEGIDMWFYVQSLRVKVARTENDLRLRLDDHEVHLPPDHEADELIQNEDGDWV